MMEPPNKNSYGALNGHKQQEVMETDRSHRIVCGELNYLVLGRDLEWMNTMKS